MFPSTETVDKVWGLIARSIAYGPLHDAGITTAKVSPSNGEVRADRRNLAGSADNVPSLGT